MTLKRQILVPGEEVAAVATASEAAAAAVTVVVDGVAAVGVLL